MLRYELVDNVGNAMIYQYMPEGKGKPGTVSVNIKNGATNILDVSPDDFGGRYACKLIQRLERFFEQKAMPKEGFVAWY